MLWAQKMVMSVYERESTLEEHDLAGELNQTPGRAQNLSYKSFELRLDPLLIAIHSFTYFTYSSFKCFVTA